MNRQYFEGVLQLRNPPQKIIDYVAKEIEKSDAWIAKTKKEKNGIDLYISSNKLIRKIGRQLKTEFGGELKESKSLFTRNKLTSKEVYRGCVLFRYYGVKKGSIISVRGEEYTVISVKNDIYAMNADTKKKVHIKFSEL